MIRLVNDSGAQNLQGYNQELLNKLGQSKGLRNSNKNSEVGINEKNDGFQSRNMQELSWKQQNSLYNAQGKKTNSISATNKGSQKPMVQFDLPVRGHATISSDYGEDRGDYHHKGIDFDGKMGDDILSAANGKVAFAGKTESGGNTVVVQHAGGVRTKYMHLDSINVKEGEFVKSGKKVGEMGNTGNSHSADGGDGSHLHFEVLEDGQKVDPDKYLNLRGAEHKIGDYGGSGSDLGDVGDQVFESGMNSFQETSEREATGIEKAAGIATETAAGLTHPATSVGIGAAEATAAMDEDLESPASTIGKSPEYMGAQSQMQTGLTVQAADNIADGVKNTAEKVGEAVEDAAEGFEEGLEEAQEETTVNPFSGYHY